MTTVSATRRPPRVSGGAGSSGHLEELRADPITPHATGAGRVR